jgi:hypothetical protein
MLNPFRAIAWTLAFALTGASAAPVSAPADDPTDANAPTPPLVYQSPLAGIRKMTEAPARDWRQAQPPKAAASDPHAGHAGHAGHADK